MTYRILVVEDDGFTRMLLCSQLRELGHEVVGEAANSAEGMAAATVNKPDLIVVDLDLGEGPSGVDFALGARRLQPTVGILMLTSYVDIRLIGDFRPLPPGTVFMVKRSLTNVEAFESAIDMAVESGSRHALEKLHGDGSLDKLRDGQIEIMRLIACGYTNSEIASQRFPRVRLCPAASSRRGQSPSGLARQDQRRARRARRARPPVAPVRGRLLVHRADRLEESPGHR